MPLLYIDKRTRNVGNIDKIKPTHQKDSVVVLVYIQSSTLFKLNDFYLIIPYATTYIEVCLFVGLV